MNMFRGVIWGLALSLIAVGCKNASAPSEPTANGGSGGGGLGHEIMRELSTSNKATRADVEILVFYDVSDSSTALRKPLGKLLERVIDTDREAVPLSYSFFGENCNLQNTILSNLTDIRKANKAWIASSLHDHTTNLANVFGRIKGACDENPGKQYCAVIVSDGGYEDPDAARGSLRKLQGTSNFKSISFVGVHTGDNPKLQKLKELTGVMKGTPGDPGGTTISLVTDNNSEAAISEAQSAIMQAVNSARKLN